MPAARPTARPTDARPTARDPSAPSAGPTGSGGASPSPTRGYLEGYYGRLLDWPERHAILDTLAACAMNAYAYAPKEDERHRLRWREPYDADWEAAFAAFCRAAAARGVDVLAGVAPGLDFDFAALDGGADLEALLDKLERLRALGASRLMLLMDDIDADFERRSGGLASEGEAHARLASRLGERLDASLVVVPRLYARELEAESPRYLPDFARALDARHAVSVCGRDVVAREVDPADCALPGERAVFGAAEPGVARETILWDNLYANDYCPRRLFVGPWRGRERIGSVLLNATGMVATDRLLLELMALGGDESGRPAVFERHGVPAAFACLEEAFALPATNDRRDAPHASLAMTPRVRDALDELQWRWKSPLSREWYPQLMGLRQDLLLADGALPPERIRKTQTPPLARALLGGEATRG